MFQKNFQAAILGQIVLTDYNNRTYRIDDVDFDKSPGSTFEGKNNEQISFVQYYQNRYGIRIRDVSFIQKPDFAKIFKISCMKTNIFYFYFRLDSHCLFLAQLLEILEVVGKRLAY